MKTVTFRFNTAAATEAFLAACARRNLTTKVDGCQVEVAGLEEISSHHVHQLAHLMGAR